VTNKYLSDLDEKVQFAKVKTKIQKTSF